MQRALGNGSCGPGTESQYHCPSSGTVSHKMRISAINGKETGIVEGGVKRCNVEYDKTMQSIICFDVTAGADVKVYDLGGMSVGKPVASGANVAVSLAGQPRGSYLLVMKQGDAVRTHKFVKW